MTEKRIPVKDLIEEMRADMQAQRLEVQKANEKEKRKLKYEQEKCKRAKHGKRKF